MKQIVREKGGRLSPARARVIRLHDSMTPVPADSCISPNYSENRPRAFRTRSRFDALSIPRNNIRSAARKSSPRHQQCLPTETLQSVRDPPRPIFATDRTRSNRHGGSGGLCFLSLSLSLSLSVFIVIAGTFTDGQMTRVDVSCRPI